jgi:hypothetical protein
VRSHVVFWQARGDNGEYGVSCRSLEAIVAILLILGIVGVAYWQWRVSLRRWPYRRCRKCGGSARTEGSTRARFGRCPECKGTGRQLRWGARE